MQISGPLVLAVVQPAVVPQPHALHLQDTPATRGAWGGAGGGGAGLVIMQILRPHPRGFWVEPRNLRVDWPGDSDEGFWPLRHFFERLRTGLGGREGEWEGGGPEGPELTLSAVRDVSSQSWGSALRA